MNPMRWGFRAQFFAGFLACVALLGYAIYTQLHDGLEPCPFRCHVVVGHAHSRSAGRVDRSIVAPHSRARAPRTRE